MSTVFFVNPSVFFTGSGDSTHKTREKAHTTPEVKTVKLHAHLIMALLGGFFYVLLEFLYRGRSHPTMFLAGGFCFLLIGLLDRLFPGMPVLLQMVLGAGIITAVELITGLLFNGDLRIWNYSACPFNFRGQICLQYSLLWLPLSLMAIVADDRLRLWLFGQPLPVYRWV